MCRKRALAATALTTLMASALMAGPAAAWPFGDKKDKPEAAARPAATQPLPARAQNTPQKAPPALRAEARRMDPLAASAFWGREVEIDERDIEAGLGLSRSLRQLGRHQDAAAAAQKVLIVDPKNLDGLMEVARAYIGMNQGFYAIEPLRRASEVAPRDWRPVTLSAIAYEQAERDDEALAAHQRAVAMAPDEPTVLTNYAMFRAGQGDLAGAEQLLRRAVALPRATAQTRQNLALVVGLQGRMDEAERLARQDLPPEMVAANMAWLRAANAKPQPASGNRSYQSVSQPGGTR